MFELALPWVLFAFPLPFLVTYFIPPSAEQFSQAVRIPFFQGMLRLIRGQKKQVFRQFRLTLPVLIWSLLLLALAGPRWVGEPRPLMRDGHNILLALDISPSMGMTDMQFQGRVFTRLAVVRETAKTFVRARLDDKLGLILFGERAYLLTPLTYDHASILARLDDATVGLAGKSTALGDALGLAVKRLQDAPQAGRVVILLTDGVNNAGMLSPKKAALLAKTAGVVVYTIGLGSSSVPQPFEQFFLSMAGGADLDENTLKEIAKVTGGRYFRATDVASLQHIYDTINRLTTVTQTQDNIRPQREYYIWPLVLAFLLLCYVLAERSGLFLRRQSIRRWRVR